MGAGEGISVPTKASVRVEFGEGDWVLCGGESSLSQGFGLGGLSVDDLCRVEHFGMDEELRWLGDLINLIFFNLGHLLKF